MKHGTLNYMDEMGAFGGQNFGGNEAEKADKNPLFFGGDRHVQTGRF